MSIASEITRLQTAKADIKDSIEGKGVTVPSSATLDEYSGYIDDIQGTPAINPLSVTENGTYTAPSGVDGYSPVVVNVSGGGGSSDDDVIFYDYDGTVVESYSADDFANLTAMPANPSHTGLTAQGWNWTLADAKAYVAKYGMLDIGQMYVTDDGKTRIYIHLEEGRTTPLLTFNALGNIEIDWGDNSEIYTTTKESYSLVSVNHDYEQAGDYVIVIGISSDGRLGFNGTSYFSSLLRKSTSNNNENYIYNGSVNKIELGYVATLNISNYAFYRLTSLESITIPNNLNLSSISGYAFNYCYKLRHITVPTTITTISYNAFSSCYGLLSVALPKEITRIDYGAFTNGYALKRVAFPDGLSLIYYNMCQNCSSLKAITIPDSITKIGHDAFSSCSSLENVVIKSSTNINLIEYNAFLSCFALKVIKIYGNITSLPNSVFSSCYALEKVEFPNTVTRIENNAFNNCKGLKKISSLEHVGYIGERAFFACNNLYSINLPNLYTASKEAFGSAGGLFSAVIGNVTVIPKQMFYGTKITEITIPNTVTEIQESAFNGCNELKGIIFPNGLTSIGSSAFSNCFCLTQITIPVNVTAIGGSAFSGCMGMAEYHLQPTTPPTLGTNVFSSIPSDCKIYVPYSADHSILEAYKTATNWSAQASKMVEEEP